MRTTRPLTPETAMVRLETLCARSEQCTRELAEKLRKWGIPQQQATEIIESLRKRRFVDDGRFASAFVRDRFRFAGWGPYKIRQALALKGIDRDTMARALSSLGANDIKASLEALLRRRAKDLDLNEAADRARLLRLAVSRGFAPSTAIDIISALRQKV